MGLIERILSLFFDNGSKELRDTVEVFRENAEAAASRAAGRHERSLSQFAGEFGQPERGLFDRIMDGINRLPRPALALGTLGLFIAAMVDPIWFAARMQGIALVPEPLWWLLGAIVSFYFGARHQTKTQEFQRQLTRTLSTVPQVVSNLQSLDALERGAASPARPAMAATGTDAAAELDASAAQDNPALADWQNSANFGR